MIAALLAAAPTLHAWECKPDTYWRVEVKTDAMTDEKSCQITLADWANLMKGSPFVMVTKSGPRFSVMGDRYPGEQMGLRVDSHKAFAFPEGGVGGAQGRQLWEQIRAGQRIHTRYVLWPHGTVQDDHWPTCGLAALVDRCVEAVK